MPSNTEIAETLRRRGFESGETAVDAVRAITNPSFCGIRQNLETAEIGQRYCRWPQDDISLHIAEVIPSLGAEKMLAACKAACDDIASHIEVEFSFVEDAGQADIVVKVDPLGGPMGVLAQCTLVPCGIRRGQFQGLLQADQFEQWVWAATPSGLAIDWQRVFAHEILHGLGLPHITTPRSLMLPTYSTTIRTVQAGDVDALVMLGYKRRTVVTPKPTPAAKKFKELFRFGYDTTSDLVIGLETK